MTSDMDREVDSILGALNAMDPGRYVKQYGVAPYIGVLENPEDKRSIVANVGMLVDGPERLFGVVLQSIVVGDLDMQARRFGRKLGIRRTLKVRKDGTINLRALNQAVQEFILDVQKVRDLAKASSSGLRRGAEALVQKLVARGLHAEVMGEGEFVTVRASVAKGLGAVYIDLINEELAAVNLGRFNFDFDHAHEIVAAVNMLTNATIKLSVHFEIDQKGTITQVAHLDTVLDKRGL